MKTAAVIPVYNHGETVGAVVATLRGYGLPVILVNDGSHADCAQILQTLADTAASALPPVHLLTHPENRGKGAAVMTGLAYAHEQGFSHSLQVDADGQHDLAAVPAFLAASGGQPEAVISGCPRYDKSVPKGRLYARYLTHVWVWINTLSLRIPDSMCGFRIYPLVAVMPLMPTLAPVKRMDFDVEILVRLDWAAVPLINLPVTVRYPEDGLSHFQPLADNLRIAAMHTRLFFGMLRRFPRLLARHWQGKATPHA
ncbi:hypothetical protein AGMMS49545_08920 [Betaproteobacteria bacterium]|nr:hypothetical protein AGMMS49545_08920 [Betaproteobacteria bacterium]GHU43949.1 hypothetical protein AGMMS50289_11260 [Betaproteobacteria bacterium]